jgi:hypothetical protein
MSDSDIRDEPRGCTRMSHSLMRATCFVMPGLVPGIPIHLAMPRQRIEMAGTSPAMTC